MSILVVEICSREFGKITFSVVSAARVLSEIYRTSFDVLILGIGAKEAAEDLKCIGAANLYYSESYALANYKAEAYVSAVAEVVWNNGHKAVMSNDTVIGRDLMSKLAWLTNGGMVHGVVGFEVDKYLSPMYAGNEIAKAEVDSGSEITYMTVCDTAFEQAEAKDGAWDIVATEVFFKVDDCCLNAEYGEYQASESDLPKIYGNCSVDS